MLRGYSHIWAHVGITRPIPGTQPCVLLLALIGDYPRAPTTHHSTIPTATPNARLVLVLVVLVFIFFVFIFVCVLVLPLVLILVIIIGDFFAFLSHLNFDGVYPSRKTRLPRNNLRRAAS